MDIPRYELVIGKQSPPIITLKYSVKSINKEALSHFIDSKKTLKDLSSKLPSLIEDYNDLKRILEATSSQNHPLIFDSTHKSMPGKIKNLDELKDIFEATSEPFLLPERR